MPSDAQHRDLPPQLPLNIPADQDHPPGHPLRSHRLHPHRLCLHRVESVGDVPVLHDPDDHADVARSDQVNTVLHFLVLQIPFQAVGSWPSTATVWSHSWRRESRGRRRNRSRSFTAPYYQCNLVKISTAVCLVNFVFQLRRYCEL